MPNLFPTNFPFSKPEALIRLIQLAMDTFVLVFKNEEEVEKTFKAIVEKWPHLKEKCDKYTGFWNRFMKSTYS